MDFKSTENVYIPTKAVEFQKHILIKNTTIY